VFANLEICCIMLFTIDYVARIFCYHSVRGAIQGNVLRRTLLYALQPLNVIDFLSTAPFYLDLLLGQGLPVQMVKLLRLARSLRLFKMAKHHHGFQALFKVIVLSGQPLGILILFNMIVVVLFGSLMFFCEGQQYSVDSAFTQGDYPQGAFVRVSQSLEGEELTPFRSIPYAMWWVCTTMTTVGYGDITPTSLLGKFIGVVCFYVGVVFLALPIAILGANFDRVYEEMITAPARKKKRNSRLNSDESPISRSSISYAATQTRSEHPGWSSYSLRRRLFIVLEDPTASRVGQIYSALMLSTILFSTLAFIAESIPDFNHTPAACQPGNLNIDTCMPTPTDTFFRIEVCCITLFSLDYACRTMLAHAATPEECGLAPGNDKLSPAKVTLLYCSQIMNVVDLVAILPFYLEFMTGAGGGSSVLRVLRLIRVFRVLKNPKLKSGARMMIQVIVESVPALLLMAFMTALMSVFFASLIVFAEGSEYSVDHFQDQYPEGLYVRPTKDGYGIEPSPFQSIPYAFWWFFVTTTTVGYGDDYPTTTAGRLISVAVYYLGIVLFALPLSIIGGKLNEHYPKWVAECAGPTTEESYRARRLSQTVHKMDTKHRLDELRSQGAAQWSRAHGQGAAEVEETSANSAQGKGDVVGLDVPGEVVIHPTTPATPDMEPIVPSK